jgi:hypothetical protein
MSLKERYSLFHFWFVFSVRYLIIPQFISLLPDTGPDRGALSLIGFNIRVRGEVEEMRHASFHHVRL